jgi:levanase/fructan beta-fructosidase
MVPQDQQETFPWRGQMSIPRDLGLRETKDGIRLFQNPAKVIKDNLSKLSKKILQVKNIKVEGKNQNIFKKEVIRGNSYWIEAEMKVPPGAVAGFKIAEGKDKNGNIMHGTIIGYDASKHQVFVDRSHSGGKINPDKIIQTMNVAAKNGIIKFEILLDKSSLEVFVNNGEQVLTTYIYPPENADGISTFSTGGKSEIKNVKIWDMSK